MSTGTDRKVFTYWGNHAQRVMAHLETENWKARFVGPLTFQAHTNWLAQVPDTGNLDVTAQPKETPDGT
jgi:hypothetical protein